jgi:hypothetical protein
MYQLPGGEKLARRASKDPLALWPLKGAREGGLGQRWEELAGY